MSGNRALNKIFRMILLTVAGRKAIIQIDNKMFYVTDGNVESTTREHRICTPTVWAIRPWIAFFVHLFRDYSKLRAAMIVKLLDKRFRQMQNTHTARRKNNGTAEF